LETTKEGGIKSFRDLNEWRDAICLVKINSVREGVVKKREILSKRIRPLISKPNPNPQSLSPKK